MVCVITCADGVPIVCLHQKEQDGTSAPSFSAAPQEVLSWRIREIPSQRAAPKKETVGDLREIWFIGKMLLGAQMLVRARPCSGTCRNSCVVAIWRLAARLRAGTAPSLALKFLRSQVTTNPAVRSHLRIPLLQAENSNVQVRAEFGLQQLLRRASASSRLSDFAARASSILWL